MAWLSGQGSCGSPQPPGSFEGQRPALSLCDVSSNRGLGPGEREVPFPAHHTAEGACAAGVSVSSPPGGAGAGAGRAEGEEGVRWPWEPPLGVTKEKVTV